MPLDHDLSLAAPVTPTEMDKHLRAGLQSLVERVAAKAVLDGRGRDLLLRIYIAGIYHGAALAKAESA
jgi:hypothetical protein